MDTAATVTIISDSIFPEVEPKPTYLKKVVLHTAGREMKMEVFVGGLVALWLVDIKFDDLCLDFRGRGEKVPIHVERTITSKGSKIARVTIEKTLKLLPKSVLRWL